MNTRAELEAALANAEADWRKADTAWDKPFPDRRKADTDWRYPDAAAALDELTRSE
jgi:hypothetical protein